jgi:integrase
MGTTASPWRYDAAARDASQSAMLRHHKTLHCASRALPSISRGGPVTLIAVRDDGTPWPSEMEMQTRVSHYLRDLERAGLIGAGTTLHGLRVSYAAWWKRTGGANNSEVADLLGDKSERMGKHYTRHVEAEANVIRAFTRVRDAK